MTRASLPNGEDGWSPPSFRSPLNLGTRARIEENIPCREACDPVFSTRREHSLSSDRLNPDFRRVASPSGRIQLQPIVKISIPIPAVVGLFTVLSTSLCQAQLLLADTQPDFSTAAQGTNGFQYGVYNEPGAAEGTFSIAGFVASGSTWDGQEGLGTPSHSFDSQHPAYSSLRSAVRRYTVGSASELAYTGLVRIEGFFFDLDPNGQTNGFVTVDGVNLFLSRVTDGGPPGPQVPFDLTVAVLPGSTIDFGVTVRGDGGLSDSTGLSGTVTTVPEPTTAVLLLAGLAGTLALRRRR